MMSELKELFGVWIEAVTAAIHAVMERIVPQRRIALVEGDERVGVVGGEHEVEGRSRLAEELLAELFTGGAGGNRGVVHDGSSRMADQRMGLYYPD